MNAAPQSATSEFLTRIVFTNVSLKNGWSLAKRSGGAAAPDQPHEPAAAEEQREARGQRHRADSQAADRCIERIAAHEQRLRERTRDQMRAGRQQERRE